MHIEKLVNCIKKVDYEYYKLINQAIDSFLQEAMDHEKFYKNEQLNIPTEQLLEDIKGTTSEFIADMIITCAVEFCVTNYYLLEGKEWNFIDYFLKHHSKDLTTKEQEYLRALNNSYMSVYKVISVTPGQSVELQDKIEDNAPKIKIVDKVFSKSIEKGKHIAVRVVNCGTTNKYDKYEISPSVLIIPELIVKDCINNLRSMSDNMFRLFSAKAVENNSHNKLLIKKMRAKDIVESVYLYYANYDEYHEMLDYDGNPWNPCIVEFDITKPSNEIIDALSSIAELKLDEEDKSGNTWLWLGKYYKDLRYSKLKSSLPKYDKNKSPLYRGDFITNESNEQAYQIFAIIKLRKNKLRIEVDSKQRANIIQDKVVNELREKVCNPKIVKSERCYLNHKVNTIRL